MNDSESEVVKKDDWRKGEWFKCIFTIALIKLYSSTQLAIKKAHFLQQTKPNQLNLNYWLWITHVFMYWGFRNLKINLKW